MPNPARVTTVVDGIRARVDGDVQYTAGADPTRYGDTFTGPAPVPSGVLTPAGGRQGEEGLRARHYIGFRGDDPQGDPFLTRVEDQVNHRTGTGGLIGTFGLNPSPAPLIPLPLLVNPMTAVYEGTLTPAETGTYQLGIRGTGSFRLLVDGEEILSRDRVGLGSYLVPIDLDSGERYDVRIVHRDDAPGQCCVGRPAKSGAGAPPSVAVRFAWEPPSARASPQIQEAAEAARNADVAVVVASTLEGEDADRHSLQSAAGPGSPDHRGGGGQPGHRHRARDRRAGADAVARRGARGPRGLDPG